MIPQTNRYGENETHWQLKKKTPTGIQISCQHLKMERFLQTNPGFYPLLEKSDNLAVVALPPSLLTLGSPAQPLSHTPVRGWPHFFPSTALQGLECIQVYRLSAVGFENPLCEYCPRKWSHRHSLMPLETEGSLPVCCMAGRRALVGARA